MFVKVCKTNVRNIKNKWRYDVEIIGLKKHDRDESSPLDKDLSGGTNPESTENRTELPEKTAARSVKRNTKLQSKSKRNHKAVTQDTAPKTNDAEIKTNAQTAANLLDTGDWGNISASAKELYKAVFDSGIVFFMGNFGTISGDINTLIKVTEYHNIIKALKDWYTILEIMRLDGEREETGMEYRRTIIEQIHNLLNMEM